MSSSSPPPPTGGAASRRYFCHQCNRTVSLHSPFSGEISCPICNGGFIEEFDSPNPNPNPTPFTLNPSAPPFSPQNPHSPIFLSRSQTLDPNDLFSFPSRFYGSDATQFTSSSLNPNPNAFNPFDFLQRYIQSMLGGANVQVILEGVDRPAVSFGDYFIGPGLEQLIQQLAENDPNRYGTPPAAKTAVASLADVGIGREQLDSEEAQCAVCKEFFEAEEVVKQMPCRHLFHKECILPWLELHNSCPVCRFELPTDDEDYEQRKGGGSGGSGGAEEQSGGGQRVVERRFRINIPWLFRGSGSQGEGEGQGSGGGGNEESGTDSGRRDLE